MSGEFKKSRSQRFGHIARRSSDTPQFTYDGAYSTFVKPWTVFAAEKGYQISVGTINGMPPSNLDFTIFTEAEKLLVLDCSAQNGGLTSVKLDLVAFGTNSYSPTKSVPPTKFLVPIGYVNGGLVKVMFDQNLTAYPIELFRETEQPKYIGAEPFVRWWGWAYGVLKT